MHGFGCLGVKLCLVFVLVFSAAGTSAIAAEALIEEVGVVFDLPAVWTSTVKKNEWPGGLLPEQCRGESVHWKWVREPIVLNGTSETLEMHAQALPANEFNQGDFVIHGILPSRPPDDGCMKGFVSRVREPNRTITTRISFKPPPGCRENPLLDDPDLACQYRDVNLVKLNLEPSLVVSWPEGFFPRTKGKSIHVLALVDSKILAVSFWYHPALAETVEPEIISIIGSMRKSAPKQ